jgi:hypothetical protein
VENVAGSALTSAMFSFLLANSDSQFPATSYAFMNSVALLGMQVGKYLTGFTVVYKSFCLKALLSNCAFTIFAAILSYKTNMK